MAARRITINDVAQRAGVSYQTVSRVINNHPDVAVKTRQEVQQIIDELGYRPSAAARSMVSQRTNMLGLITSELTPYFFSQFITGAEYVARMRGYYLLLACTEGGGGEADYLRLFSEKRVEGLVFPYFSPDIAGIAQQVSALGIPVVGNAPDLKIAQIDVDNRLGGFLAMQCIIEAGHRQIGMITGPPNRYATHDRTQGSRDALHQAGLAADSLLVEYGDWTHESGCRAMHCLLDRAPYITAVFVQNDDMAIGALMALWRAGRRVPDDIAVVGYDDIPAAAYTCPPLTTIRQPMKATGEAAVNVLIDLIENPQASRSPVLMPPALVRRESC